jgi:D-arabinose 5-phosphate isomerase GutQ
MLAEKLKRRGSSLISITNKANCSLAKMSDCNINYYVSEYKYKQDEDYDLTSQMAVVFILVLIGTSDFSNMLLKEITMGSLAVLSVAMIALRFIHMRQEANSPKDEEYEY